MQKIRTYTELLSFPTFEERFQYLRLDGTVGSETFGFERWLNQVFYQTEEWRKLRRNIVIRDNGCDLACPDRQILGGRIIIHHLNPITAEDIRIRSKYLLDPEYLVAVSEETHNAIHYGDEKLLVRSKPITRLPNDTCPWR